VKSVHLSNHARTRALQRGATQDKIEACINESEHIPMEKRRWLARKDFPYNLASPVNVQFYRQKTVDVIFVKEESEITVITVKVYFSN
jgi:hypothetical protein